MVIIKLCNVVNCYFEIVNYMDSDFKVKIFFIVCVFRNNVSIIKVLVIFVVYVNFNIFFFECIGYFR